MKTRTLHICRSLAALAVAATASLASAQNITIPFDPSPSMYVPQAALDPPRPPRSQNVGVARGQSPAPRPTSTPAQVASPASPDAAKSVEPDGTRRAVLFAVGEFNDSEHLSPLAGTRNDMALIYERLTAQRDVSPEQIVVLADGDGREFAPGVKRVEPTCANFTNTVKKLAAAQEESDVLFIFVSTHGGSRAAEKDAKTRRSYICPKDAIVPTDKVGADGETEEKFLDLVKTNNLVPTLKLLKELQTSKGKVVAIIDACQNEVGSEAWSFNSEFDEWVRELRDKAEPNERGSGSSKIAYADSNITVLTACSSGQTSRQITVDDKTYGAFSYAFAEGLAGTADRYAAIDGEIKLLEAYNYASGKTRRLTNGKQVPSISEAADAYKIVVTKAPKEQDFSSDAKDIYEMVNVPDLDTAVKNVLNSNNLSILTQIIKNEPDDADVNYLTGYFWRLRGANVKGEARGKAWNAALRCYEAAGEELTLFVDGSYDTEGSKGCFIYSKPNDKREDYVKVEKGKPQEGKPKWIPDGSTVVIDRIKKVTLDGKTEYRARIARCLDLPKNPVWVSCRSLKWDRTLAESVVAAKAPQSATSAPSAPVAGATGTSTVGAFNAPRSLFNL